ncbi:1-acyl-sn-glycerol-3-phosphate acyltransferase [Komagataeibacter rhaeticus]|uniref:lysophospholipid acyltransferase family protein n=1 Tax=Komagataeibacter rhaeticus TaxID=215221 RepID=UPI0004D8E984|nr:lysophospholipid acyltransferase family protein [Komagataeibacter rhaeticus]KDU95708.1 acyl-phosphate glycerol 3-phosphate acyltransferase [Komagataeibacter rhaeticus AF1]MBL7239411.1 1-acyl-sn-glycerol-3-phosphate acyltransferase [Komagataeibacter rhaeticus]PYD54582.1 1-acyl-sn-glycerol-3-phosphate acyltransferase [Komagataeibacter rhaeticus]GBQ15823.1 1-acyl-sn-glycerol-3-phosphate acyltransferase [Komagataeibacter rhaeticus DSM 16663]
MTVLRALAFNLYFLLLTIVMGIVAFPIRLFAPRLALGYAKLWTGLTLRGLRHICGIAVEVSGREHLPHGPCLLACQHQSMFDTLVWMNLVPLPTYVMKRELERIPLVGPMLRLSGMIPVDRDGKARALRTLLAATDDAARKGRQIIIFPEGTRTPPGAPISLQPGIAALSAHTGLPVIPVATDAGLHWGRNALVKRPGTIHIAIGRPLPPGLRRAQLLPAIGGAWRSLCADNGLPMPAADAPSTTIQSSN